MTLRRMRRLPVAVITATVLAGASALTAAGAASADTSTGLSSSVSLTVLAPVPGQVITGPNLAIQVAANGYRIDARYAGTPNLRKLGHYHEILDGNLVDMTPLVNGNKDTMPMTGVSDGWHTLTLVPSNNDHSMIMSAAVSTATTPGAAFAAVVSMPVISACATGLRTNVTRAACVSSGSRRSSTYVPPAVSSRGSSVLTTLVPRMLILAFPFFRCATCMAGGRVAVRSVSRRCMRDGNRVHELQP